MITPENVRWAVWGTIGVPLILLIGFELATGRAWYKSITS